jgi:superfamily II DNA or RNA helicase
LFTSVEQRLIPKIRRVWTEFKLVHTGSLNPSLVSKQVLLKFLCGNKARNAVIVEQLVKAAAAGRKPIVLSERLQHLDVLEADFKRRWDAVETGPAPSTGFYVGGMKEDELEDAAKARVIFATRQFAEEGLDIPELDTIFLTTPMSDVDQAVGRILRPAAGKKEPIVVDFRDENVSLCKKAGDSRERFYRSKGWA